MRFRLIRRASAALHLVLIIVAGLSNGSTARAQTAPASGASPTANSAPPARSWRPTTGKASLGQVRQPPSQGGRSNAGNSTAGRSTGATTASAVNAPVPPASDAPSTGALSTSARSSAVQTHVLATPAELGDCDYWIVSSRDCGGTNTSPDAGRCLLYLNRTSEQNLVRERRETFLASVRPDRPVCFVMHGSYNRWRDVMVESRRIHRWLRSAAPELPMQVVFFTWPSDGNMPFIFPVDIAILGRRSSAHGAYLASLISQLPADQRVAIVGHSHGARTAVAAMHLLGGGALEEGPTLPAGSPYPRQVRAVLVAAAIDHNWLNPGQRYGQALLVPERVLLMRNSRDSTLAIYPMRKFMGERALGKDGLGQDDRFALGSLGPKVVELNAAEFADWHHAFADFHQRPELAKAMVPFVYFQDEGVSPVVVPAGPTIGSPNGPSINSPASPAVRAAPAAKPPTAVSGSDSLKDQQPTGEDRFDDEEVPEIPRIGIELRVEP